MTASTLPPIVIDPHTKMVNELGVIMSANSPAKRTRSLPSVDGDQVIASSPTSECSTSTLLPMSSEKQGLLPIMQEKSRFALETIQQGGYAPGIEGLRGFAILLTATSHVTTEPFAATDPLGHCGVTIFFVLSGYNIMGSLCRTAKTVGSDDSWTQRLRAAHIHRLKRLLPSILTMLITLNILNALLESKRPWAAMARYSTLATTFTYNSKSLWVDGDPGPFINLWSLGPTEQFNLLMSLCAPVLMALPDNRKRRLLILVAIASYAWRVYTSAYPDNFLHAHWHYDCMPNLWRFLVGAMLRYVPLPRSLHHSKSVYLGILFVFSAPYLMWFPQINYSAYAPGWNDIIAPMSLWGDILVAIGACLIIAGCRTVSKSPAHYDHRSANILLESAPLQLFGKVSYSFYLFQLPLLIASGWPRGWTGIAFEALALCCAMATTFWVEPVAKYYLQSAPAPSSRRPSADSQHGAAARAGKEG